MKKASEYIDSIRIDTDHYADQDFYDSDIEKIIKQAQKDTIETTLKIASENAEADFEPMGWLADQHLFHNFKKDEDYDTPVDKSSILDLKDNLFKEIDNE